MTTDSHSRQAIIDAEGFAPRHGLTMISCVRSLTVGLLIAELVEPVGASSESTIGPMADYPVLTAAISGGFDADEQFRVGLSALLDGFAVQPRSGIRDEGAERPGG